VKREAGGCSLRSQKRAVPYLLPHVLTPLHAPRLHEVFEAPGFGKRASLPSVVDRQQRQVISLGLVELGLLRVRLRLLVLGAVEGIFDGQQRDDGQNFLPR